MPFKKHKQIKIDIDTSTLAHDSPEVAKRLERIESNYAKFDEMMVELESRLPDKEKPASSSDPKKPR